MTKDFLFFNYSWVANSTYIFKSIEKMGYSCDFVDEASLPFFKPEHKYKCVVLYLHEHWTIPITNHLINNFFQDSFLIQHDDTDFFDVQTWGGRVPNLVMQRELIDISKTPYPNTPTFPFHFPISSKFDPSITEKPIDICFLGNMTNPRRAPFVKKVQELANGTLKHLNWYLDIGCKSGETTTSQKYIEVINSSKIGLHYFGNSYDSWRMWELASTKTAMISPHLKLKSITDKFLPFKNYCIIQDDFQDLEEKILFMMENDNYKSYAEKSFEDYNKNHTPEKCFEYYLGVIKRYINI